MNATQYADIDNFLKTNGVTFPYIIDKNMTYDQLYSLLGIVHDINVDDEIEKEILINNIIVELFIKHEQRVAREQNITESRNVSLALDKGEVPSKKQIDPNLKRYIQEFIIKPTKGGKKSKSSKKNRHYRNKKKSKTRRK